MLAANSWSKLQNSKFQIQYGCQNFEKLNKLKNVYETRCYGFFLVAEDEFKVQIIESRKLKVKSLNSNSIYTYYKSSG